MNFVQTILSNAVKRGPWTSILGVAIIIGSFILKKEGNIEDSTMLEMIGGGIVLIMLPDPKKKAK